MFKLELSSNSDLKLEEKVNPPRKRSVVSDSQVFTNCDQKIRRHELKWEK